MQKCNTSFVFHFYILGLMFWVETDLSTEGLEFESPSKWNSYEGFNLEHCMQTAQRPPRSHGVGGGGGGDTLGPLHTRDWEPMILTLRALSLVGFTLRLRDRRSKWMQDGCKVYMDSYMASNGSCCMVTWAIFINHLLEVGLSQHRETMALRTLTAIGLSSFIMCEDYWYVCIIMILDPVYYTTIGNNYTLYNYCTIHKFAHGLWQTVRFLPHPRFAQTVWFRQSGALVSGLLTRISSTRRWWTR